MREKTSEEAGRKVGTRASGGKGAADRELTLDQVGGGGRETLGVRWEIGKWGQEVGRSVVHGA
jgi:hypothetical protein